ncbi:SDR family NAD(P)-dependent oxidoreductase [Neobacillus sp. NPDC093182]|uniref:SDR family NAD(P)-dependent oxidoreductase n=1 Tax=Neobacillus sp. NPDC093182 TaxID=3364297 RepID=UPI0037FA0536
MNTILITGASSGIGRATALYFAKKGWNVIAGMRSPENDTELKDIQNILASKFAVEGFSEALSYELAPQNIIVKLIEPGAVNTAFGRRPTDFYFDDKLEVYNQYRGQVMQALGKLKAEMLSPEKVAEVVYLAATNGSNQLRYVVGEDAKALINLREKSGDEGFIKQISQMF